MIPQGVKDSPILTTAVMLIWITQGASIGYDGQDEDKNYAAMKEWVAQEIKISELKGCQ